MADVKAAISLIRERIAIVAADIASYDPALDRDDGVLFAGVRIMTAATPR